MVEYKYTTDQHWVQISSNVLKTAVRIEKTSFENIVFRINDVIYCNCSLEFIKACEQEVMWAKLHD